VKDVRRISAALIAVGALLACAGLAGAQRSAAPPSGKMAAAFEYLNAQFRRPLSLPDLVWDPMMSRAAQNHVDYWAKNKAPAGHEETKGAPGFTGVEPWDRCRAAGTQPCGEVAYPETPIESAMPGWLVTPYHGLNLVSSDVIGCGTGTAGSVCDLVGNGGPATTNPSAPANAPGSPVRVWPYDGARGVALEWGGGEIPDPLRNYGGDKSDVGPPLFLYVDSPQATLTLNDEYGHVLPFFDPDTNTSGKSLRLTAQPYLKWHSPMVARQLAPSTNYVLTVVTADGLSREVKFRSYGDVPNRIAVHYLPDSKSIIVTGDSAPYTVTAIGAGARVYPLRLDPEGRASIARLPVGTYTVCASSGGEGTTYLAVKKCLVAAVRASARAFATGSIRVGHGIATATFRVTGPLLGHVGHLDVGSSQGCGVAWCGGWDKHTRRTLMMRPTQTLSVKTTTRPGGVTATLTVPAFDAGHAKYDGFSITVSRIININ
jgi:hypothetical protein